MTKACEAEGFVRGKLNLLSELAEIKETVKTGWAMGEMERNAIVAAQDEEFKRKVEELQVRGRVQIESRGIGGQAKEGSGGIRGKRTSSRGKWRNWR